MFHLSDAEDAFAKGTSIQSRATCCPRPESCLETWILPQDLEHDSYVTTFCNAPVETSQLPERDRQKSTRTSNDAALSSYCQMTVGPSRVSASNLRSSLDSDAYSAASTTSSIDDGCGEDGDQRRLGRRFTRGHFTAIVSRSPARSSSPEGKRLASVERLCIRTALDDAHAEAAATSRLRASVSRMRAGTINDLFRCRPPAADSERRRATQDRPMSSFNAATTDPRAEAKGPEGLLHKRGQWNPAWKERYFVLTPCGNLEYYKAVPDGARPDAPAGVIPVALRAGCCGEREGTRVRDGGRDGRLEVIELTVRAAGPVCGRTYVLGAATVAEHRWWMVALRRAAEAWRRVEHRPDSFGRARSLDAALPPVAGGGGRPCLTIGPANFGRRAAAGPHGRHQSESPARARKSDPAVARTVTTRAPAPTSPQETTAPF